jgi:PPOX class probable F420-dependent enzyme
MNATALAQDRFVSLTTFKRDGTPVSTPVWCATDGTRLLIFSEADSWKVKRIRRDAHVRLAPCSARGKPRGLGVDGEASIVEDTSSVEALLARKYGWAWPGYTCLMAALRRVRRQAWPEHVTIVVALRGCDVAARVRDGIPAARTEAQDARRGRGRVRNGAFAQWSRDTVRLLGVLISWPVSRRTVRSLAGEAVRSLPGDDLVADAKVQWTHAITIRADPADIWPWLVQMGCRRAGWYSYDGLDNGGLRSAERIVAALQHVQVGDIFPMAPVADDTFVVRMVEPGRALVLGDVDGGMSWAFVLDPVDQTATRLHTRIRAVHHSRSFELFLKVFLHPVHFAMQRKQLLNLKRLVEARG